jgi:hypothetical protein
MADPTHEIPYTVGDQERQVRIEDTLNKLCKTTEDAAVAAKDAAAAAALVAKEASANPFPRCATNIERLGSLEKSRSWARGINATILGGSAIYAIKLFLGLIIKGK